MFEKNQARQAAKLAIKDYFEGLPQTTEILSWVEIEAGTGVRMGPHVGGVLDGRAMVREYLDGIGRPHAPIDNKGSGIRLSSAENAADIMARATGRVLRGVRRAAVTKVNLTERHVAEMSPSQRSRFDREQARIAMLEALGGESKFRLQEGKTKKAP